MSSTFSKRSMITSRLVFFCLSLICISAECQCSVEQIAKLLPTDGAPLQYFGNGVAIEGNVVIVKSGSGKAYLFDATTGQQRAELLTNDGTALDGRGVSISGNIAIIGAYYDDVNGYLSGSAYLFDTTTCQQIAKLLPNDGAADDGFGGEVSISETVAIVNSVGDDDNGASSGSTYLFNAITGQQMAKILPDDGANGDRFGWNISINGNKVVVGAYQDDDNGDNSGSAYLFDVSNCSSFEVVMPDSVSVTRGIHVAGGVSELAESDNADFSVKRSGSDLQSRTEFEVKSNCPTVNPSSMQTTLEGSVFARSEVTQTIELFDYAVNDWEQIDSRAATRFTDSSVTVAATGDLSRFVESGTMCIQARIRYQSPVARQQFSSNTDQFIWTIGQ